MSESLRADFLPLCWRTSSKSPEQSHTHSLAGVIDSDLDSGVHFGVDKTIMGDEEELDRSSACGLGRRALNEHDGSHGCDDEDSGPLYLCCFIALQSGISAHWTVADLMNNRPACGILERDNYLWHTCHGPYSLAIATGSVQFHCQHALESRSKKGVATTALHSAII